MTYEKNPELLTPIEFMDIFANATIEGELITRLDECHGDPERLKEEMRDPNLMVVWKAYDICRSGYFPVTDDPDDEKYNKAFINLMKIFIVLFKQVPWVRSRMGWFLWFAACYANPDAYYPLTWENHFEPAEWYHAGEMPRVQRTDNEGQRPFVLD